MDRAEYWSAGHAAMKLLMKLLLTPVAVVVLIWCVLFGIVVTVTTVFGPWPDAVFKLAPESRLPRWFTTEAVTPSSPTTVTVEMAYYSFPFAPDVIFTLRDSRGTRLAEVEGDIRRSDSNVKSGSRYPSYEVITVGAITEIIEHRRPEPMFYITDDNDVRIRLGVE